MVRLLAWLILLFGLWFFGVMAPYGLHIGEDGDLLYLAYAAYRGQVPYVDFSSGYTPLFFYWHAALFSLFGVDAVLLRFSVALGNAFTLLLLYRLATRLVGPFLALVAPLFFLGSLLCYPPDFATFNVPYPSWYNIPLWLASLALLAAHFDRGRVFWIALAGLCAGLSFSIKPNIGLFNLAALAFVILWWHSPAPSESRLTRAFWLLLAVGTVAGIAGVFRSRWFVRDFDIFPLPLLVLAAALLISARRAPGKPGFLPAALALLGGFAACTLPWLLYFLYALGLERFLSDVFMLGSSYELFFYIPYRTLGGRWDWGVLLLVAALVLTPRAVRIGWLPAWVLPVGASGVATLVAGYIGFLAPMPEGFYAAVSTRLHDLGFFFIQAVNWAGVAVVAREVWRDPARRSPYFACLVMTAVSAPAMALGMYPRSDFMHLVISVPVSLLLATALLGRVVRAWELALPQGPAWRLTTAALVVAPPVAVALIMASPSFGLAARMTAYYAGAGDGRLVPLAAKHASLVVEPWGNPRFRAINDTVAFIDSASKADELVFPFPNLNVMNFLAGRLNPTRQGYFHPGFPDHPGEAAMVEALHRRAPRLVTTLHDHDLFITTAPLYYFLFRDFVRSNYRLAARFGPYDVFTRLEGAPGGDAAEGSVRVAASHPGNVDWDAALATDDAVALGGIVDHIRKQRDPAAAVALTRRAQTEVPHRVLMLRITGEFGDERSLPGLAKIVDGDYYSEAGQTAASSLYFIASKVLIEGYWFARDDHDERQQLLRAEIDPAPFSRWLRDGAPDGRLQYSAAWMAGVMRDRSQIPYLYMLLGGDNIGYKTAAAWALTQMGVAAGTADAIVSLLRQDDMFMPSLLIDLHAADPETTRRAILRGFEVGTSKQRETLSWIAAVLRDPELTPSLAELHESGESDSRVREAAAFALGAPQRAAMLGVAAAD